VRGPRLAGLLATLLAAACGSSTEPPPGPPTEAELAFTMDSSTYLISTAEGATPSLLVRGMIQGSWRPDGVEIAVVATGEPHGGVGGFPPDQALYTMNPLSSGGPFAISVFDWSIVGSPIWEPDGSTILYMRAKILPSVAWIERVTVAGALETGYSTSYGVPPSWSHDGRLVATCCTRGFNLLDPGTADTVRTMEGSFPQFSPVNDDIAFHEPVTGHVRLIRADSTGERDLMVDGYPRVWSPDGRRLAFDGTDGLYTINADGSGLLRIGPPNVVVSDFAWSADSKRIAYVTHTGSGPHTVYMALADDTERRPVVSAAELCCLSWRPPVAAGSP